MPKITVATVVKLLIASLIVGMALAFFELSPQDLLGWAKETFADVLGNASDYVQWAISYVLLGAVIVVPIWLVFYLWRAAKGSTKS